MQIGFHSNCNRMNTQTVQAKPASKAENLHELSTRSPMWPGPLKSVNGVCDQGNNMLFTHTGSWIINHETGRYTWFPREHGVYVLHSWISESPTEKPVRWPDEPFPLPECQVSAIPRDTWNQRSL